MLEINCIDSNKEQIDSNVLETLKEYLNLEKNILEKEIEIRNRKIDLAKDPSNNGIIDNIKDLEEQKTNINCKRLLEYNPSSIREIIKKIKTKISEFSLIKDQQEMWELENKFYQERFVDNRKEHEK